MAPNAKSADALDDDFLLEDEFAPVADSTSDQEQQQQQAPPANSKPSSKKRARNSSNTSTSTSTTPSEKPSNKKRKPTPATSKFTTPTDLDEQADLWNTYMKKAYPGITQLELEDIQVQPKHMYTTEAEPTCDSETFLEDLAKTAVSTGKGKNKVMHGAPQVLIICSSALRVLDLVKRLRPLSKRVVLKLFSRHVKIAEHKKLLENTPVDIAVGTPNRILKLLSDGDLKVNRLRLVVIDCWQDDKMRVVVDMDDTRKDLFAIWRDVLLPASSNPDYGFKLRLV
ncbi:hypothetical protein GQ54DRAFT_193137 [Martensiomyces pterosporus]|nr:hypothetical protein GQ54DRAFT_193137 [Martensiomyces pterosporus]